MAASGYSSAQQHYSTRDGELPEGWVYYRIREDAVVGEPSYSEVVAVRLAGSSENSPCSPTRYQGVIRNFLPHLNQHYPCSFA